MAEEAISRPGSPHNPTRPNLQDESDNFIIETAVASGAVAIVTRDVRDLRSGELRFPDIAVLTPEQFLERYPCPS